jgi:hypothetical protein
MTGARSLVRSVRRDLHIHRSILRTEREISAAVSGSKPILVGPWLSEIGFEVLYWIPMLNWFCETYGVGRERVVAISRGGADAWYRDVAGTYVDLFDHYSLSQVRELNEARVRAAGRQKQWRVTDAEHEILASARKSVRVEDANVLHPSTMYWLFRWFWSRKRPISLIDEHTHHRPLPDPGPLADRLGALPSEYIAVKAYFSSCFPDTEDNRAFARDLLGRLAGATHVVLLSTGLNIDDHSDYVATGNRILNAEHMMTPRDNLHVQSAIIARSRALVTTYGGFSYLGPYLGVPSVCFFSDENFNPEHLDVMHRAGRKLDSQGGGAAFLPLNTRKLEPFELISRLPTEPAML